MQQGPQYPYPQQPYPQQQYPGYPPPKSGGKTALVVVLVVAGVLVLAGAGVGAFFLLTADDKRSAAVPPTTSASGEPDKYTSLPLCSEVGSRMNNLPPLSSDAPAEPATTSDDKIQLSQLSCSWSKPGSSSGTVSMMLAKSNQPGSGNGPGYAKAGYDIEVERGAKPITETIGKATKAADVDYDSSGTMQCGVRFYQGNVDATVIVTAADTSDKNIERCRRNAHSLAKAASESLS
ncbi:hypothetical protein H4696_008254 [Amycolatopsis lexingtonensis]|uniref:DUF3558 domain-containing protein n=1 Tax=Amycolatopsis lexingtonensis TaxID=218822 RepID=A0ABR9ID97_9PSEU|nr:hypothetical protein [Amycolatopsis lexingtonensis]MBE1501154.1 hypothetical protein [Amycolatopsis lexingtonensis]